MMEICKADFVDLNKILELQYLAYQSEAVLFGTNDIPPLKQTMEEVIQEYRNSIILKMISEENDIIGSVRAREDNGTAYIGKLMVHPDYRCCGCGTKLLRKSRSFIPENGMSFLQAQGVKQIFVYIRETDTQYLTVNQ